MAGYMRGNVFLRFLDKYLGIPLVFMLGQVKKIRKKPRLVKKIALLKTAGIGDTVLLSAIVKDIKDELPDSEVYLFVGPNNYEIATIISELFAGITIIELPMRNPIRAISLVRRYTFDVWLDFGSWPRINALLSYFSDAKFKVGFKTKGQYRHYVYDVAVEHNSELHELFNYKKILEEINIRGSNLPSINVEEEIEKNERWVVVHMFPAGVKRYLKEWPEFCWVELIDYLTKKGYCVVLTGSKVDKDRALRVYRRCKEKDSIKVVAGDLSLKEVVFLLKKSYLVVSVNTGIMHLASALNCNLVALHGPTSPVRWGPLNSNSVVIQSPLVCSPCLNLGFEYGCSENRCMRSISVGAVIEAVNFFLKRGYK